MKNVAWILMLSLAVLAAGCAKKTASEQLQEDLKKAGRQMQKEVDAWK